MRTTSLRTAAGLAVAALATGLTLTATSPASAEGIGVRDPRDTTHGSDLRSVEVRHEAGRVVVVTRHTNLRRDPASGSGGAVFLDTDPDDAGPEYVLVGGFFVGTDYRLLEAEGWHHRTWGDPVEGRYSMRVDYDLEQVRIRITRATIGRPDEVRVGVRVGGTRPDGTSSGLTDWLGAPRSFTPWVARG